MKTQRIMFALIVLSLLVTPVFAQSQTSVTGSLKDADGGVLPGVTVTARNTGTGLTRTATTSADGRFTIPALPPGVYDIRAELQGFAPYERKGLRLEIGTVAPLSITLQPGGVAQEISVTADRPLIESTESDVSTTISQEMIENLPITERNAITLALLVPGVSASAYFDPTKSRDNFDGVSFGASSGSENLVLVDGADNNDDVVGSILQFYPQDSIQEFEVITSRFKAEYGHTDGGVVNMITKSGANTLSGGGYWLLRSKSLNSRSFVEEDKGVGKGDFKQNVLGTFLGGPIAQDRVHYFANIDYTDREKPLPLSTGGKIPQIDQLGSAPQDFKQTLLLGKITAQLNDSNYFVARYGFQDDEQLNPTLSSSASVEHGSATTNRYHSFLAKNQTVIGGDKLNEALFQVSDFLNEKSSNAIGHPLEGREIIAGAARLGHNINFPQQTEQRKYQFVNNFSWRAAAKGDHDLKAGFEYQRVDVGGFFSTGQPFAQFRYATEADYVSGKAPSSVVISNGVLFDVGNSYNNIFAFFVQDDWRVSDRVTLNLGLRWDLETNDWSQQDRTFVSADPLFFGGQPQTDKNNFGPRLGFAYDTKGDGALVVRGGYGLYYQQIFWNSPIRNAFLEGKLSDSISITAPTFGPGSAFCPNPDDRTNPNCIPFPSVPAPVASAFKGRNFTGADPNMKTPSTHQMSFGFSTLMAGDWGLDADFVHTRSDNQIYRVFTVGRSEINGLNTSNFGRTGRINTQGAEQRYSGMLLALRKRFEKFSAQLSYTFGRGEGHAARQTTFVIDDLDFDRNFGPNFGQRDHIFSGAFNYRLPHEFELSTIVKLQSGFAFTAFDPTLGDVDGDGNVTDSIAAGEKRGAHRGDGFSQVDLRLAKKFTVGKFRPQVFFEVFNLFNSRNEKPEPVDTRVGSSTFGESTQVAGQFRQAQVSLRFDF